MKCVMCIFCGGKLDQLALNCVTVSQGVSSKSCLPCFFGY